MKVCTPSLSQKDPEFLLLKDIDLAKKVANATFTISRYVIGEDIIIGSSNSSPSSCLMCLNSRIRFVMPFDALVSTVHYVP